MTLLLIVAILVVLAFGGILLVGAPYLPTLRPQIDTAFELLALRQGQTILELGCGDGKVLAAAAQRGYRSVGIELNPFLVVMAWLRTRRYGDMVHVVWGNYWQEQWPPAEAVFVFLLDRFMAKLDKGMQEHKGKLVSIAFCIPGKPPVIEKNGVFLYDYH